MTLADRFLDIRRDPHSDELLARGGDPAAYSILQRAGFVAVVRLHETYHRAPTGLAKQDETRLATTAVARLRAAGYHVDCHEDFDTDSRPASYLPPGSSVAHIAERIREAVTREEAADAVTELTADCDGILAALHEVLTATADFHDRRSQASAPYTSRPLRYLADELRVINDLAHTCNALADRHAPHPGHNTCTQEVPVTERERSAVCTCPPPPRTLPAPPPPVAASLRR
ncbi:hypothetical protein ACF09C_26855 [Streptomyces sp. NPDC014870]|uniref:hypothetical protein n=1 Tax=Streptomyces sp. NPDC014870 TaxID=3364925 RepID=UPI0036F633CC